MHSIFNGTDISGSERHDPMLQAIRPQRPAQQQTRHMCLQREVHKRLHAILTCVHWHVETVHRRRPSHKRLLTAGVEQIEPPRHISNQRLQFRCRLHTQPPVTSMCPMCGISLVHCVCVLAHLQHPYINLKYQLYRVYSRINPHHSSTRMQTRGRGVRGEGGTAKNSRETQKKN